MNRISIIFILSLIGSSSLSAQRNFFDPETGVHLSLNDSLRCSEQMVNSAGSVFRFKNCRTDNRSERGRIRFSYQVIQYPFSFDDEEDGDDLKKELLKESISASASSVLGEIVYEDLSDYKGYNSAFWRIAYDKGKGAIKSRAIIKNNSMIIIMIDFPVKLAGNAEIDHFMQSLYIE